MAMANRDTLAEQVKIGPGRVVLVVGPSGAGKDTLLCYAAKELADRNGFFFPRRLVTRPANPEREDHDSIAAELFDRMVNDGDFALSWNAHGHGYIIPSSVIDQVRSGSTVVFNASRSVIRDAFNVFQNVSIILIDAPRDVLARRLLARNSDSAANNAKRLERCLLYTSPSPRD